jgi:uncharacterized protein
MPLCFFVSDLHGRLGRYASLLAAVRAERPAAVFLGGDLLPPCFGLADPEHSADDDFVRGYLAPAFERLRAEMAAAYPDVFAILGNDDPAVEEPAMREADARGVWHYVHGSRLSWRGYAVCGYACVPPTPFRLKDWERYDVSRYADPGCTSPEEGSRTVAVSESWVRYGTIADDLQALAGDGPLDTTILLFHAPPYRSGLDRASLDGQTIDHVPLDVHVGSIAIQRFIQARQPLVTLHGHIHESARLTGAWCATFGRTHAFSAAHDGPELALVRFDPENLAGATRELVVSTGRPA